MQIILNFFAKLNICISICMFNFLQKIKEIDCMSFIHDFIMESNQLEDTALYEQAQKMVKKRTPVKTERPSKKEVEAQEPVNEGCGKEEPKSKQEKAQKQEEPKKEITEEKINEATEYVNLEDIVSDDVYVEALDVNKLTESKQKRKKERSAKALMYENSRREKRIATYRKAARIDESVKITEDNIKKWAFDRTCMWEAVTPEKLKADLLGLPYEGIKD